jgi:thiaminase/transcriptional activator TenA
VRLSDQILAANEKVFQEMLTHRFVGDIKADCLPVTVFHRYLAYEGAFVKTAISIFSYATACAPDIASQRWLIGVMEALANKQMPYFETAFVRLNISPPRDVPEAVSAFDRGMLHLSRDGTFIDIVTAMFAAEWMYWTWCNAASKCQITDPNIKEWIDLHITPEFEAQANWLKDVIDTFGEASDANRLSAIFQSVMQLEVAFHSAAYVTEKSLKFGL